MSDSMWYVAVDGQTVGPMSEAELIDAIVTEKGVVTNPTRDKMLAMMQST